MNKPRLVNLLDDFGLGGVTRGLAVFDSAVVRDVVETTVHRVSPRAIIAPRLDAELIVTHMPPNWRRLAFLASLALRNPGARIIHVEHSYTRNWERHNVPFKWRFRLMLRLALAQVDKVVCVSHDQAKWLAEVSGCQAGKIEVIYPSTRDDRLVDIELPLRRPGKPLRIGTYGRFHECKGFDTLITAFRAGHLPDCELAIGGFGPDESRLRALAGRDPRITFVGKVNDVAGFLERCHVVAMPSRWEAYGQVANEAREAGRPILVSGVDGLAEQVGDAGYVVDFSSPQSLRTALAGLEGEGLMKMGQAGRDATRFCHSKREAQWAFLLGDVLGMASLLKAPAVPA